jgi:hypothetical protein
MSLAQILSGTPAVISVKVPITNVLGSLSGSDVAARLSAIEAQLAQISQQIVAIDAYLRALGEAIVLEAKAGEDAPPTYP